MAKHTADFIKNSSSLNLQPAAWKETRDARRKKYKFSQFIHRVRDCPWERFDWHTFPLDKLRSVKTDSLFVKRLLIVVTAKKCKQTRVTHADIVAQRVVRMASVSVAQPEKGCQTKTCEVFSLISYYFFARFRWILWVIIVLSVTKMTVSCLQFSARRHRHWEEEGFLLQSEALQV